jgi:glycosyltransferase involved in cell wall biosynthesis
MTHGRIETGKHAPTGTTERLRTGRGEAAYNGGRGARLSHRTMRRGADRSGTTLNDEAKQPFLAGAAALLFPIDWPEPFGLVMIEAMACGTPVIAFRSGSVPEVIDEGVTGFVVDDEEQAVQAVKRLMELDRKRVRDRFEERFTAGRMAADYVSHYQSVVNGGSAEYRRQGLPAGEESAAPAT